MSDSNLGDYSESLDQIIARSVELDKQRNPDLENLKTVILSEGTRTYKLAKYWTILDRHTGQVHHHSLNLVSMSRTKKHGWQEKPEKSITLTDEKEDEIQRLIDFLATLQQVQGNADYTIIRQDDQRIGKILEAITATDERGKLVDQILSWVDHDSSATQGLIQLSEDNPLRSKSLAAALNYGRYSKALTEFKSLVEANHPEAIYQRFLQENHWIFGSEYSELLPVREISNGIELDFPMRRTLDGYLEIIEIKRPLSDTPLFVGDRYLQPRTEAIAASTQANNYLQIVERDNYKIRVDFGILIDKVRAKVIIGRDGDDKQQEALRLWNSSQNRIEVVTFDQLIKIGEQILAILAAENQLLTEMLQDTLSVDDIPF